MKFRRRDLYYLMYGLFIFFGIGIYWWSLPYEELNMQQAVVQWSIFIFGAALACRLVLDLAPQKIILSSFIGLIAMLIVRIVSDKLKDPSTHNLLLVEIMVASVIVGLSGGAGIFIASLFAKKEKNEEISKTEIEQTKRNSRKEQE